VSGFYHVASASGEKRSETGGKAGRKRQKIVTGETAAKVVELRRW
jgi:hypothetical protein